MASNQWQRSNLWCKRQCFLSLFAKIFNCFSCHLLRSIGNTRLNALFASGIWNDTNASAAHENKCSSRNQSSRQDRSNSVCVCECAGWIPDFIDAINFIPSSQWEQRLFALASDRVDRILANRKACATCSNRVTLGDGNHFPGLTEFQHSASN